MTGIPASAASSSSFISRFPLSSFLAWLEIPVKRQRTFLLQLGMFLGAVVLILFLDPTGFSPEVVEGMVCPKTIRSPKNISFVDERKTDELRRLEEEKIEPVIAHIENAENEMTNRCNRFFTAADNYFRDLKDKEPSELSNDLIASYFPTADRLLDLDSLKELTTLQKGEFDRLKNEARQIIQNLGQGVITSRNLESMRVQAKRHVLDLPGGNLLRRLMTDIVKNCLSVNAIEDEKQTRQRKDLASHAVAAVKRTFQKGQKIIDEGVIVTADDVYVLRTMEKQIHKNQALSFLGNSLLAILLILTSLTHLRLTRHMILKDVDLFRLMGGLWIAALLMGKIVYAFGTAYEEHALAILFTPLPAVGLLMATLLDVQVAIFHQMLLGVLMFVVAESNARFAIVGLIGGVIGVLAWQSSSRDVNIRGTIGWSGVRIGVGNAVALLSLMMLDAETFALMNVNSVLVMLACGFGNGVFAGILANGVLPYLENAFSLATGSRLLELTDLSQPLLKRLAEEAPGTYQHSLLVANLSEAAAIEINGDALLSKIGGYFHDIGKIKRPLYFAENQSNNNQHDNLTPYMSSLILVGHIRDGIDLGREHGLPDRVISFVREHHGTTLISYFYEQAKTDTTGQEVNEERFRYPGPKPQTKETAIVMLADSVEAASRTLPQRTHSRIEGLVKKIIENKLNDENQLDESDLTLKDIEKIESSFVRVLTSMYHGRVDYPGKLSNQPKGGADGSSHQQSAKED
ncbi:MAG: HDIG domain-containing protein [Candidatus Riflebacteria bacterium]|nr:HDIG domain-containing protein [Candidatus Riflebacteria bacterium]